MSREETPDHLLQPHNTKVWWTRFFYLYNHQDDVGWVRAYNVSLTLFFHPVMVLLSWFASHWPAPQPAVTIAPALQLVCVDCALQLFLPYQHTYLGREPCVGRETVLNMVGTAAYPTTPYHHHAHDQLA
jgi:hypothetical protein